MRGYKTREQAYAAYGMAGLGDVSGGDDMGDLMIDIHGGNIYSNNIKLDFSVNINPLGITNIVENALFNAVSECAAYPDICAHKLTNQVIKAYGIPKEHLIFGNGSSELFMVVVHALKPKKTLIPVPSFYGYEHAAKAAENEIVYYDLKKENGFDEAFCNGFGDGFRDAFCVNDYLADALTNDINLLFIANPNNPTGKLVKWETLVNILQNCRKKGIYVVLDESFIEFCGEGFSMLAEMAQYENHDFSTGFMPRTDVQSHPYEEFENLIIIRSFTKIFAIPGVRLGYLACCNEAVCDKIRKHIPEWNISCFAQAAGAACCECAANTDFLRKTVDIIKAEREFLETGLRKSGIEVFPSDANFILAYSKEPLYERLLEKGILIRDCSNFRGLSKGFYRIAVKSREENERLIREIANTKELSTN